MPGRPVVQVPPGGWDVVCLDAVDAVATEEPGGGWRGLLAPQGRLVVVGDHLASPLRALDAVTRGGRAPGARLGHRRTVRAVERSGLRVHQVFGLMRSSNEPAVAFDALAPDSLAATLGATLAHVHGARGRALGVARRLGPRQVLALCPGWMVVASTAPVAPDDRVVGKVSNRDSEEIKLVRGSPAHSLERRLVGAHAERAESTGGPAVEVEVLRELEAAGFTLAPRLLPPWTATSYRCTWQSGSPLPVDRLGESELLAWVHRAARALGQLQAATRAADGTVLVHGDFWLGNLLVEGDEVTAVVDWTEAHRGPAQTDRQFLVSSLERWVASPGLRRRLEQARDAGLASA